jgi:hypothetical protein
MEGEGIGRDVGRSVRCTSLPYRRDVMGSNRSDKPTCRACRASLRESSFVPLNGKYAHVCCCETICRRLQGNAGMPVRRLPVSQCRVWRSRRLQQPRAEGVMMTRFGVEGALRTHPAVVLTPCLRICTTHSPAALLYLQVPLLQEESWSSNQASHQSW